MVVYALRQRARAQTLEVLRKLRESRAVSSTAPGPFDIVFIVSAPQAPLKWMVLRDGLDYDARRPPAELFKELRAERSPDSLWRKKCGHLGKVMYWGDHRAYYFYKCLPASNADDLAASNPGIN